MEIIGTSLLVVVGLIVGLIVIKVVKDLKL